MARPKWIPKDVWKFIKHGRRPDFISKKVWKMLKKGIKVSLTEAAVRILENMIVLLK